MAAVHPSGRPRVAIVQEYVPKYRTPFFRALRARLDELGVDLVVAAGKPGARGLGRQDADETEIDVRVPQRELNLRGRRLTLRRLPVAVRHADVVVFEQARRNVDVFAHLLRPRSRPRIALWGHGVDHSHAPGSVRRGLLAWLTKRADHVFVYTEVGRRALRELGIEDGRITVVRNSTDTSSLRRARDALKTDDLAMWTHELGIGDGPVFGFIGALDRAKGVDLLLGAWSIQIERDPSSILLVAGDGVDREVFLDPTGVARPGIRLLGYADDTLKARMTAVSQCLVVPGQIGLVALDAIALDLPLISVSTAHHGPELHYLRPERDVFLCEPTPAAVAATMERVVEMRQKGLVTPVADDSFTVEGMAERFADGLIAMRAR